MFISQGYTVSKVLKYAGVSSSTWYSTLNKSDLDNRMYNKGRPVPGYTVNRDGTLVSDISIVKIIKDYRSQKEFKNAGDCTKLKHYIKRDYGIYVNHKKIYRLCKDHNLLLPKVIKNKRRGSKVCINRVIRGPNELWQFDIKYGYIHGENRFFFVLAFLDVFTRELVDYHIGLSCKSGDLKHTLSRALSKRNIDFSHSLVIRSDNGPQMTSFMFQEYISKLSILEHEYIPPSTPNKNAHVESFFSILEREHFNIHYFRTYMEAYKETINFINYYNTRRIHGSLNYKTPIEIAKAVKNKEEVYVKNLRV
jgi:putative transposase